MRLLHPRGNIPRLNVITLLFDLMEEALNIGGLVRLAVSISSILAPLSVEIQRRELDSDPYDDRARRKWYCTELALTVVAVLRHYQR